MTAYIRELARGVFVFLLATVLIYGLLVVSPGGTEALGVGSGGENSAVRSYLVWLQALVFDLDLGETRTGGGLPIMEQVLVKGRNTVIMVVIALVTSGVLSLLLGLLSSSVRHITVVSHLAGVLPYCLSAVPAFIIGSYLTQNYPCLIYVEPKPLWLFYLVPGVVLGVADGFLCEMLRHAQDQVARVRGEDYMLLARAKGARLWRHIRYELGLNLSQLVFSKITMLISGTVILEYMFKLPGIGSLVFGAAEKRDVNLLLGSLVVLVFVVIVSNYVNRLLWVTVDPRLR